MDDALVKIILVVSSILITGGIIAVAWNKVIDEAGAQVDVREIDPGRLDLDELLADQPDQLVGITSLLKDVEPSTKAKFGVAEDLEVAEELKLNWSENYDDATDELVVSWPDENNGNLETAVCFRVVHVDDDFDVTQCEPDLVSEKLEVRLAISQLSVTSRLYFQLWPCKSGKPDNCGNDSSYTYSGAAVVCATYDPLREPRLERTESCF